MFSYGSTSTIVVVAWTSLVCATGAGAQTAGPPIASRFPPPQIEMRVPFEPSAFPSAGRTYLTYEVHLRNFAPRPVTLRRVEVLDAESSAAAPVAAFEATQLDSIVQQIGASAPGDASGDRRQVAGGGRIISARDGIPDNVPRHEGFRPAVPLSMETLAGNTITLDVGGTQFAYYMHLQPGSVQVKTGDRVRRGQVLARIGNSGDSREPHLHFEVTTSSRLLVGEGVPYLIDRYRGQSADGSWQMRTRELPLRDMVIDFGQSGREK